MIVVDASAMVAVLVGDPAASPIATTLRHEDVLHAPEHLSIEIISALRGLVLRRELAESRARIAADRLALLRVVAHAVLPLRTSIWALRDELTAYDAVYLALAEVLGARLLTLDAALAGLARRHGVMGPAE